MRVKRLTFRYSSSLDGFDDTPLLEFTRDKEVLSFREHFFTVNDLPHLAFGDATRRSSSKTSRISGVGDGHVVDLPRTPCRPSGGRR